MTRGSLRRRLGLVGGLSILAALVLSVIGLTFLFDRHVERVALADLEARALSVAAMIEMSGGSTPGFRRTPVDPLYERPFSGHYWQLELGEEIRRSRSLWDYILPHVGPALPSGSTRVLTLQGPRSEPLLAFETWLVAGQGPSAVQIRVVVATDRGTLDAARSGFVADLVPYSVLLGLLLVLAFWAQLTVGLRPLTEVRGRVAALRAGHTARMGTDLPAEVLPLAGEIDTLLADREQELARARNRAGDLAHGLKTPLQALFGDAAQVRDLGQADLADSLETVGTAMRAQIDRELRRARIQSDRSGAMRSNLRASVTGVVNVLRRTPEGAALDWQIDIAPDLHLRMDPDDLTEAIGALAENAARHARSRVIIRARPKAGMVAIRLDDDGPGAPAEALADLGRRGFRADQRAGGQGIGLAIVADIVEAARGGLSFANGGPGLTVLLTLPAA